MTPAEQARAEVEAWFDASEDASDAGYSTVSHDALDTLITRLTPVFERAQVADKLRDRPDPIWVCPIPEHGQCAELCFECCLSLTHEAIEEAQSDNDALRERAERAEAVAAQHRSMVYRLLGWVRWSRCPSAAENALVADLKQLDVALNRANDAEAKQHATRDELKQRDGTIIDLRAALEMAEADVALLRDELACQNAVKDGYRTKLEAAEADVARLREFVRLVLEDDAHGFCVLTHGRRSWGETLLG